MAWPLSIRTSRNIPQVAELVIHGVDENHRVYESWRPTTDLARQTPREAVGSFECKVQPAGVLQSIAVGSEHAEMARSVFEKAPFSVILHH
jgi:hypothetical protein